MEILAVGPSWGWIAALIGAGLLFAVAELFLPSYGILTGCAVLAILGAVVMAFMRSQTTGIVVLLAILGAAPFLIYAAVRAWPHLPIAGKIILQGPPRRGTAGDLAKLDPREFEGRVGTAQTMLRPSGKMTIEGRTLDCVTEGDLVPAGTKVRVLDVRGAKVVVRAVSENEEDASA